MPVWQTKEQENVGFGFARSAADQVLPKRPPSVYGWDCLLDEGRTFNDDNADDQEGERIDFSKDCEYWEKEYMALVHTAQDEDWFVGDDWPEKCSDMAFKEACWRIRIKF